MSTSTLRKWGLPSAVLLCVSGAIDPSVEVALAESSDEKWIGVALPSSEVMLAPPQRGILAEVLVKAGDVVRSGQILGKLDSRLQEIREKRLAAMAQSDAEMKLAVADLELAKREEERGRKLNDEDVIKESDLIKLVHNRYVASIRLEQARLNQKKAISNWEEAKVIVAQRSLKSPIDGLVAKVRKERGEAVEELEPVFQVVALNPLWVEFDCPVSDEKKFPMGKKVRVSLTSDAGSQRVGEVIWVSSMANPASHTFRVRLRVPNTVNPWKGGLKVRISHLR